MHDLGGVDPFENLGQRVEGGFLEGGLLLVRQTVPPRGGGQREAGGHDHLGVGEVGEQVALPEGQRHERRVDVTVGDAGLDRVRHFGERDDNAAGAHHLEHFQLVGIQRAHPQAFHVGYGADFLLVVEDAEEAPGGHDCQDAHAFGRQLFVHLIEVVGFGEELELVRRIFEGVGQLQRAHLLDELGRHGVVRHRDVEDTGADLVKALVFAADCVAREGLGVPACFFERGEQVFHISIGAGLLPVGVGIERDVDRLRRGGRGQEQRGEGGGGR